MRAFSIVLALVVASCSRSRATERNAAATSSPVASSSSGAQIRRAHRAGSDVTFFVVSDTHFGFGYPERDEALSADPVANPVGLEEQNKKVLLRMNALPGRKLPQEFGGVVGAPRGLLVTGDLTEWGREVEWNRFVSYYGLTGKEGLLRFPVFEAIGNHDKVHGPWVEQQVAKRHGKRFYAWDWDDLHFVSLGEAPDDEGLAFLKADLDTIAPDVPVVLYFHLAIEGPWSTGNWFGDGDFKERLGSTIAHNRVVAIFHGHHHANGHYVWRGVDVFKPGAVKNSTGTFTVAHYTDGRFDVAYYDYERDAWAWWQRKELAAAATAR